MPTADAAQQRLYSPNNHISPGNKSSSCFNKRPTSCSSATTPTGGVLKNVMVSHHMDRSSSTPRLTLKFHHVKRHENGIATAADVSRLHASTDGTTTQLPMAVSVGTRTNASISYVDSQSMTASLPSSRYHGAAVDSDCHHLLKNSFEKNHNSASDNQQSLAASFSPQFEDISDAEDDGRSATVNTRDSVSSSPAYSFPPASQCLPQFSAGLYPSAVSSTLCISSAGTVAASYPPVVGWNGYSGYASQTALTLPASTANVGLSSSRIIPWAGDSHTQMGMVNHLSPVMNSSASVLTADALQTSLSPRQPFVSNRYADSDGIGCVKSEFSPVTSEVLRAENTSSHLSSFKLEKCNGYVNDVKSEPCIKAEFPVSHAEAGRELCSSVVESKPCFPTASLYKSEETILSNSDTCVEDSKDSVKINSLCSEPGFHSTLLVKPDVDDTLPSHCNPCHQSYKTSMSPSMQTSCLEADINGSSFSPSAHITNDVIHISNNLEPKVPPLRIVIPSKVCSSGSLSDGSNTNTMSRCGVGSLPYVVNRTHSADGDVVVNTAEDVHRRSDSSPAVFASSSDGDRLSSAKEASVSCDLFPAKRRKIKHSSKVRVCGITYLVVVNICYVGYML